MGDSFGSRLALTFGALALFVTASLGVVPENREMVYRTVVAKGGPYPYFAAEIFGNDDPVDVAILGSSLEWVGIDADFLESYLSTELGRPVRFRVFAANWRGEDLVYFLARDLLEHKKVKLLVIGLPPDGSDRSVPHQLAAYWWPTSGEPERPRLVDFGLRMIEIPRNLLIAALPPKRVRDVPGKGSSAVQEGFGGAPFHELDHVLTTPGFPNSETLRTIGDPIVDKSQSPLNPYQAGYLSRIRDLADRKGTRIAVINIPTYEDRAGKVIGARANITDVFRPDTPNIGVVSSRLWAGVPAESIKDYYYNTHLNANGSRYFSRRIAGAFKTLLEPLK